MAKATPTVVEIEEEIEGEYVGTADLLFYRIGASVPLNSSGCAFDIEEPPKQPLAISERFGVLFIAHSEGFLVVSTKDVIRLAKDIKEMADEEAKNGLKEKRKRPSVKESSILDVPMGRISILSLSADSSILAASSGDGIHLFSVPSLIKKKQVPFVSSHLGKFGNVKDLKWCTSHDKIYVALSYSGALFHGDLDGNLRDIMHDIDAVDWSVDGSSLAIAKNESLRILSCKFDEQIHLPLLQSWTSDDPESHIKVDSIKWLQSGTIIIGCIQVKNNNDENGYFIQVINSGENGFKESSKPVAVSFIDFFHAIGDSFTSLEWGPHLFASFLDRWRIAVLANRRNMDDHVMLLEFPYDKESTNVMGLELEQEKFTPRIELQENRDENLILALGVDKVSMYEQLEFVDGEDVKQLSPYCILLCLTIEGKVVLFHVTRISDPSSTLVKPSFEVPEEVALTENENRPTVPSSSQALASVMKLANGERPGALQTVNEEANTSLSTAMPVCTHPVPEQLHGLPDKQGVRVPFSPSQLSQSFAINSVKNNDVTPSMSNTHGVDTQSIPSSGNSCKLTDVGRGLIDQRNLVGPTIGSKSPNLNFISSKSDGFYSPPTTSISNVGVSQRIETPRLLSGSLSYAASITSSVTSNRKGSDMHPSSSHGLKTGAVTGGNSSSSASAVSLFLGNPASTTRQLISSEHGALKSSGMLELDLSGRLHSVNDMVKELDNLLLGIEQDGKFGDACISSLKNSILALEKGLEDLLQKSMASKVSIGEVATKVQYLQDMMVQISAREGYVKGMVKQASNSQYWDIWNRQKLCPDFELKQEQILKANQSLRSQLIELEKHFNILELNKFGENSGTFRRRSSLSASEASRRIQNLHRLHNTITSQLSAAEHLSDCLSKQMSVLNIASPPMKQQSTAKELLESIGVHQDSFESPDMKKATLPFASSTKGMLLSASSTCKDARNKASEYKGHEPETARRRRDSLDRSLVRFEPPKTTVKRTAHQVSHKVSSGKSNRAWSMEGFSTGEVNKEQYMVPSLLQNHADNSQLRTTRLQENLGREGNLLQQESGLLLDDAYKYSRGLSQCIESGASRFSQIQTSPLMPSAITSTASFSSTSNRTHGNYIFSEKMVAQSDRRMDYPGSYVSAVSENSKLMHNVLDKVPANIATSSLVFGHGSPVQRPSMENSERRGQTNKPVYTSEQNILASSPVANLNVSQVTARPLSSGVKASSSPMNGKFGMSQPVETSVNYQTSASLSAFSQLKPSVSSPVPLVSTVAAKASSSSSIASTMDLRDTIKFDNEVKEAPSLAATSASSAIFRSVPSSSSSSFQFEIAQSSSSFSTLRTPLSQTSQMSSSTLVSTSLSLPSSSPSQSKDSQTLASYSSNASAISAEKPVVSSSSSVSISHSIAAASPFVMQPKESQSSPSCSSSTATISQSSPQSSIYTSSASVVVPSPTFTMKNANETKAKSQDNLPGTTGHLFAPTSTTRPSDSPSTLPSLAPAKSDGLDLADIPEDDMEEEAPESTTTLNLESLGGFGLGLSSTSSAPKSNPFGGSFAPAVSTPASSPFSISTPPGQLFKPASLNLPSVQQTQGSSSVNPTGGSGGFRGFGQPSQIGSGQQALGSVLGAFGQSRQFGNSSLPGGLPSGGFGSGAGGFSTVPKIGGGFAGAAAGGGFSALASGAGGFAGAATGGGFSSAATGGGFASLASGTGGFATATGVGGFAALASMGSSAGGFAAAATGSRFAGAASGSAVSGAGAFGAVGSGGFGGSVGSSGAGGKPPPQLLMQMRK